MKTSMKIVALGLGATALCSLGFASQHRAPPPTSDVRVDRTTVDATPSPSADPWTHGEATDVTLAYRMETTTPGSKGAAGQGKISIDVDAVLEPCEGPEGASFVAAKITRVKQLEVGVVGNNLGTLAQLEGQTTYLEMKGGRVEHVHLPRGSAPLEKQLLQGLFRQLQLTTPAGGATAWNANEPGLHGIGSVRYTSVGPNGIERVRDGYEELTALPAARSQAARVQGRTAFTLDGSAIASMKEDERVSVNGADGNVAFLSHGSFALSAHGRAARAGEARCVLPEVSTLEARPAAELRAESVGQKLYEEAAANRTMKDVRTMVATFAQNGSPPASSEVVQSVALLLAHPELSVDLQRMVADPANGKLGRQLAIDILASAGHEQAQTAMRAVFESGAVAITDPAYGVLVQRFSFVDSPSVANLELLAKARATAKAKRERTPHHAATFALGSSVGRLAKVDRATAERFDEQLVADLRAAKTADDKIALLAALGNASLPRDLSLVVSYAQDKDELVRAQAATSLRRFEGGAAWTALLDLLGDAAPRTANHALDSIAELHRSPSELGAVAARIAKGQTHPELDPKMVALFAKRPPAPDQVSAIRDALLVMRARAKDDAEHVAKLDKLLGALNQAPGGAR